MSSWHRRRRTEQGDEDNDDGGRDTHDCGLLVELVFWCCCSCDVTRGNGRLESGSCLETIQLVVDGQGGEIYRTRVGVVS